MKFNWNFNEIYPKFIPNYIHFRGGIPEMSRKKIFTKKHALLNTKELISSIHKKLGQLYLEQLVASMI